MKFILDHPSVGYVAVPVVSKWQIEDLLTKRGEVSFDLEISKTVVEYRGGVARFQYNGVLYEIELDSLPEVDEESCEVYALIGGEWRELSIAADRFYKLCVFNRGWAPTLMIDGITMHSVLENPLLLTSRKVERAWGRVFECCTGLGYTAIEALKKGARHVITVEVDPHVLTLASLNPYSRGLWSPAVDVILGDCYAFVQTVRDSSIDFIIHDPPRLSHATQRLYSEALYREFYRILKRGGGVFHYVSQSGTKYRGLNPYKGVAERLRRVGFAVEKIKEGYGIYARRR
ncbi:TPA: methyltransferase [Pyrobaculum aerophilum]|uniref:Methyltransferase n=1 Tax=Pyrobaculum aerophilum TaxID=13773 RepID=A0A832WG43_9CREN|nr:methyltransferase [Pyrobaculum aerophilum]